jgi:ribonuclease Z
MSFKLTILGCNSAIPTISRFTTSQALQCQGKIYLIDAGEGAQIRINNFKIKRSKIHQIFISHLHGDHFFGLPGILTSMNLNDRKHPMHIYGPVGLNTYIQSLQDLGTIHLNFEVKITEISASKFQKIFEDEFVEVFSFPLKHRVPTTGFLFKEKAKPRKLISEMIEKHSLSFQEMKLLKKSHDVIRDDGEVLQFEKFTIPANEPSTYAYCSDTIYDETLVEYIQDATLLYHESTYLDEFKEKARDRGHSTAKEAAKIASLAKVQKLVLGHFSSRYKETEPFKIEAQSVFEKTSLAEDGREFNF